MSSKQCKCGKGYVSQWDNKCGKCRTKKEQCDHLKALLLLGNATEYNKVAEYTMLRKLVK